MEPVISTRSPFLKPWLLAVAVAVVPLRVILLTEMIGVTRVLPSYGSSSVPEPLTPSVRSAIHTSRRAGSSRNESSRDIDFLFFCFAVHS